MNVSLLSLLLAMGVTYVEQQDPQILYHDPLRNVDVRYDMAGSDIVFSAELPVGWSYTIKIDGDRNGIWGNGPGMAAADRGTTADHGYGQGQDGHLCSQKILASFQDAPNDVLVSSECDGYPTKAHLEVGQPDAQGRAMMTIRVPSGEIFGKYPDAHLQICLWDTKTTECQFSPAQPYVLKAPTAAPAP